MARIQLSNTDDWKLKFDDQDVRGYDALDADGNRVGAVRDMIVDTDEERVDAVLLEDGTEYPARDLSIGDGVVYLTSIVPGDEARAYDDDYGHVVRGAAAGAGSYDAFADDFRTHHRETFGATGRDFGYYEPAYRYGYDMARDDRFRNRDFADAEADLRRGYAERHDESLWEETKDAVRGAYDRVRRTF